VNLSATLGAVTPATVTTRKPGLLSITITNSGNIAASGLVTVIVSPSSDGSTALPVVLASFGIKTTLLPGRLRTIRLRLRMPSTLSAGSYFPYLSISLGSIGMTLVGKTAFAVG
jgi:hypothetical protein